MYLQQSEKISIKVCIKIIKYIGAWSSLVVYVVEMHVYYYKTGFYKRFFDYRKEQ